LQAARAKLARLYLKNKMEKKKKDWVVAQLVEQAQRLSSKPSTAKKKKDEGRERKELSNCPTSQASTPQGYHSPKTTMGAL
jgi:hypothetical protein